MEVLGYALMIAFFILLGFGSYFYGRKKRDPLFLGLGSVLLFLSGSALSKGFMVYDNGTTLFLNTTFNSVASSSLQITALFLLFSAVAFLLDV